MYSGMLGRVRFLARCTARHLCTGPASRRNTLVTLGRVWFPAVLLDERSCWERRASPHSSRLLK